MLKALARPGGIIEISSSVLLLMSAVLNVCTCPAMSRISISSAVCAEMKPTIDLPSLVASETVAKPCEMEAFGLRIDSAICSRVNTAPTWPMNGPLAGWLESVVWQATQPCCVNSFSPRFGFPLTSSRASITSSIDILPTWPLARAMADRSTFGPAGFTGALAIAPASIPSIAERVLALLATMVSRCSPASHLDFTKAAIFSEPSHLIGL